MTPSGREGGAGLRLTDESRRGQRITLYFNDQPVMAYAGESVAAALIAEGRLVFRRTARRDEPRGLFCGMGVCYECMVIIDGQPGRRACVTEVRDGMTLRLQEGWGESPFARSSRGGRPGEGGTDRVTGCD